MEKCQEAVHMMRMSETVCGYLASFVVEMLSAIHAGPVPDEVTILQNLKENGESTAHGLTRSCRVKDRKKKWKT